MEKTIENEGLIKWLYELGTENPVGFIAMQIFEGEESSTSCVNCSPRQLCIMLLILCQEHTEMKSAILGAADEIRTREGGEQ